VSDRIFGIFISALIAIPLTLSLLQFTPKQANALDVKPLHEEILLSLKNEKSHWVVRSLRVTYYPNISDAKQADAEGRYYPEQDDESTVSLYYSLDRVYAKLDKPYKKHFSDEIERKIHKEIMNLIVTRIRERWHVGHRNQNIDKNYGTATSESEVLMKSVPKSKEEKTENKEEPNLL
jgi:hypothetical protein